MRKFLLFILIIAVIIAALIVYLKATTPVTSSGVRFPLTPLQHELLASVPASAEAFALIPSAAAFHAKLLANPITRGPMERWSVNQSLPRPWMMGGADLVVWRAGKQTSYAIRLDPLRAAVVRMYLMLGSGIDARVKAGTFLINAGAGQPLGTQRLDQMLAWVNGLESADAIIVQQAASRGAFPPIGRPTVTTLQIGADDIELRSVGLLPPGEGGRRPDEGRPSPGASRHPLPEGEGTAIPRFPRGALISAIFREPPRVVGDLDRLLFARLSHLLDDGGSIVLYDVNAGTFLPRPDGLIIVKATPDNRKAVERIRSAVETFGEIRESGGHILLSFDRDSMKKYESETLIDAHWPSNDWAVRIDPKRTVPLLEKLADSTGLRLAASRVYRSARDLRGWIEPLANADSIEAAHLTTATSEELRVRIASK
ncbi:MAG TPA: hypothetical protein VGS96_17035 [Thermoanaerobaculia bacterium]|nr:hypothetical protein [Thermoanaerobaculia bacterium]